MLLAIAIGAVRPPNVADAIADAAAPLGVWIHLVVVAFVFLETTVLLGFFIHGELVLMLSGVAAARGDASLVALIVLAWGAAVAGDVVGVLLGRRLGRPFIERHGRRLRLGPERLARVDGFFARHGRKALFLGRFTGFLRSVMSFVVGSAGLPVRRLLPVSAASALVWTATFTVIGYALADSFASAGQTATRITSAAIVVVIAAFVIRSRVSRPPAPAAAPRPGGAATGDRPAA
ncbi:DedA family protein [Solirubrobacter ginsenosidimutans]|uniref:DedA family protein n=1 Tax=Solirubrobacter ginsenosidimutans TaxID=490573 RepID=A0A9X3MX24_9ACTN|nr:DedA family protein [Solirubrobacter ginsenosidimutans]MDA0164082.1 DedA family protein [Solirubrobacter ginsenosidimutans]